MAFTVSKVARLTGVSVRTLHHYDAIALVRPSDRTEAGYRQYEQADLVRLQQVLFFRELGFPLDEIKRIVDDPSFDRRAALQMQRKLLAERAIRTTSLINAVDAALQALETGKPITEATMTEAFTGFDHAKHEAEAEQRWGKTPEFIESKRRTAGYGKKEWAQVHSESEAITAQLAALMSAGKTATDREATKLAEQHRLHLDRWFYPCPHAMHRKLGEMYVADPRFAASYEKVSPGLAQFLCDAIQANAAEQL